MGGPWPSGPGPTGPSGPTGPGRNLTPQDRQRLAEWQAAEELQRATDAMHEHGRYGRARQVDADRLHAAEKAWDLVRGQRPATRREPARLVTSGGASW